MALLLAAASTPLAIDEPYPPPMIDPGAPADFPLPTSGTLNTIPTYEGSGQSIHPSVVDMGGKLSGYRWWLADTPWPNRSDSHENPSIFASNDRINWIVPDGVTNPLAPDPDGPGVGFNSDVELIWDEDYNRLVCYWRDYIPARAEQMYLRTATSPDGLNWTVQPLNRHETMWQQVRFSPAVWRAGPGDWRMWRFGDTEPPGMWTAPTALGPWTHAGAGTLTPASQNWHGDIIRHNGIWIGIFSTRPATYPMASHDGLHWTVGPVLSFASYRATLLPSTEAGQIDVWASQENTIRVTYRRVPETLWTSLL